MSSDSPTNTQPHATKSDGREVEWQLGSSNLALVRRWLTEHSRLDGWILEAMPTLQLADIYFDTIDWRIHRAGFALRIRSEAGRKEATLKSLEPPQQQIANRREVSEPLQADVGDGFRASHGPVGRRVGAVAGAQALRPLFEVRTHRERFAVRRQTDSQQTAEIALDETVIARPGGEPQTSFQRVEVEALAGDPQPLEALVKVLRHDCALQPVADSKYSLGLKSAGLAPAPPAHFVPTSVDASMRMDEIAHANLRRYWGAWLLHEPAARLGDDPEALHDLRVAGRRMDAILRQFGAYLPESMRHLRQTLKKVLRALGDARDFDVALAELESFARTLTEADRDNLRPLQIHLDSERARAREGMLSTLDSVAVQRDLETLTATLAQPSVALSEQSGEGTLQIAGEMIRARYRKVRKGADRLGVHSSMEAYHEVRGRAKKLRYALEAVAVIYGKPADELLRALRRWQEKLGIQQDAGVASRRLQSLAAQPPKGLPPETLFLMGRLAEHYANSALRARKRFPKAYRKVRIRWRRVRSKLEELAIGARPQPDGQPEPQPRLRPKPPSAISAARKRRRPQQRARDTTPDSSPASTSAPTEESTPSPTAIL